jgi:hypothetical protein
VSDIKVSKSPFDLGGAVNDRLSIDGSHIDVVESKWSPTKFSIVEFLTDEKSRGQGKGGKLLDEAITKYGDELSGAFSSKESLTAAYNRGFRPIGDTNKSKSLDQLTEDLRGGGSVTMSFDSNTKPPVDVASNIKPALPMDLTSRVGRAKGQDFDLNKTLYHGTKSDIENFDLAKTQSRDAGYIGEGVYLTGNKNLANFYAKSAATTGDSGSNVMPVVTNVKNTKTFTLGDKSKFAWDIKKNPKMSKELTEKLVGEGFDSAQVVDGKGELVEMVVFDPKNIRSKFAKFDPENKGKASLLGGLGALGVGIGLKSDEEYE